MKLYPLLFEPNLHEVVWGGKKLTKWKQLPAHEQPVGESCQSLPMARPKAWT